MVNLEKRVPKIIAKLDAARAALEELVELTEGEIPADVCDGRVRLQTDLREYADYLESATWWKKGGTSCRN